MAAKGNCQGCELIKAVSWYIGGPWTSVVAWTIKFPLSPALLCAECAEKWKAVKQSERAMSAKEGA